MALGTKNIQRYEPRHAGGVGAVRSQRRREQVDLKNALLLLNAQIDKGNDTAVSVFIKLRPLERLRVLAGAK